MNRTARICRVTVCLFLPLMLLIPLSSSVEAAEADELPTLGLDDLIKMALEASPEIQESLQDLVAAESDLSMAKAAQWAQLDAIAFGGIVDKDERPVVRITDDTREQTGTWVVPITEGRTGDAFKPGPFGSLDFAIIQPLYTFGKIVNRRKAASQGVEAQRAAVDQARGDLVLRVKELYFSLILSGQGKESAEDVDSFIDGTRERVDRLLELGSTAVDESDRYRLESYAGGARAAKAKAESGVRLSYMALKRTVGMPSDRDFQLDAKELPKDARALGEQEEYIQKALKWRPEFEQIEKGLRAKKHLVDAEKADLYPTLFAAVFGSFAGAPRRERMPEPYIGDDLNHSDIGPLLGATWHFDLGITQAEVRKARAEYHRLLQTKALAERDIPLQVAKFYQEAQEEKASYEAFEEAASAARKWIVVAFANYDMGIGRLKEILDAIDIYGRNQGDFLLSLYNYHLALAKLSHAIGEYRAESIEP